MYLFIIFIKNSNIASVVADSLPTSHIDNNSPQLDTASWQHAVTGAGAGEGEPGHALLAAAPPAPPPHGGRPPGALLRQGVRYPQQVSR